MFYYCKTNWQYLDHFTLGLVSCQLLSKWLLNFKLSFSTVGQTIGALLFAIFAGQPLVVVMTTAPLALFIKVIYSIAEEFEIDFLSFYAAIGLWNTFFVSIYSIFNMSVLMKFSTRSTEEIFSNFITIAFIKDSITNMVSTFKDNYWDEHCSVVVHKLNDSEVNDNVTTGYEYHEPDLDEKLVGKH